MIPPEISAALISALVVAIGFAATMLQLRTEKLHLAKERVRAEEERVKARQQVEIQFDRAALEAKARELENRQKNEEMIRELLASQLEQNKLITLRLDRTVQDLATVEAKLQVAEKARVDASSQAATLQAKVETLTADANREHIATSEASQRRDQQIGELRGTLEAQRIASDSDRQRMEKQIADLSEANKIISNAKGAAKRELDRVTKERDEAVARAQALEERVSKLQSDVERLQSRVDELTKLPQAIAIAVSSESGRHDDAH